MLYVGASTIERNVDVSTIAQNGGAPTIALADSKWFQHRRKKSHSSKKLLFHVKQIAFERRGPFERSWYSNDVRTVNIYWNVSRNEAEEWRRRVWKDGRMRGVGWREGSEERFLHCASRLVRGRTRGKSVGLLRSK